MIKAFYDRSAHRVTISGHAGTAPKGEDLVCSGVTSLALTLATNVQALESRGIAEEIHVELEDGLADISCRAAEGYGALVSIIYDTVCMGLAEMARANAECMEYRSK